MGRRRRGRIIYGNGECLGLGMALPCPAPYPLPHSILAHSSLAFSNVPVLLINSPMGWAQHNTQCLVEGETKAQRRVKEDETQNWDGRMKGRGGRMDGAGWMELRKTNPI
jgi:hypothetical protein